jgi:hypothetical protein
MDNVTHHAQNVVTMTDYKPDIGYAAVSQVEAYWEALRGDRLMPKRSEIDPRGIENALEYAFIVERIAPGIARMRIAGSHLSDLMGMEVRGMPLSAFFGSGSRRQFADTLEEVFEVPATCTLELAGEEADGPALTARMVLLPLKSDLGDVSRMLGCLVSNGALGTSPARFTITSHRLTPLKPGAALFPTARSEAPTPPAVPSVKLPEKADGPGFGAPKAPFKPATASKRPPYLRLVKSDD